MPKTALTYSTLIAPTMCLGMTAALIDPSTPPAAYVTRWRMFRLCGVARLRSAAYVIGGVL